MIPDESYKKLQHLMGSNDGKTERGKIRKQLEIKFMTAWQLKPDRLRLGGKLAEAIRRFTTRAGSCVRGLDHYTCYTGENDQRVIVTQPYGVPASEIQQDLTLDDAVCPEVIDATEWAFYCPGHAKMHVVKFPFGFKKALEDFPRKIERAEIQKFLSVRQHSIIG